ncbi:MAG: hypothetical protein HY043_11345 [Verrucomicrobia bacterium]|nr:hypothetical protein [Verrucomicrobiota bacterium]
MKLKLKEDPREWRKFALAAAAGSAGVLALLWKRHAVDTGNIRILAGAVALTVLIGLIWPRVVRPVYRAAMTGSFYGGQIVGRVLLSVLFLLVLTPLALLLRVLGKDLLRLKRDPRAQTYWREAKWSDDFDRQF